MDMQQYGRELAQTLGHRSLELLRTATAGDVRNVVTGRFLHPEAAGVSIWAALGAFAAGAAIGAGVTAFLTPTTGPELRKQVARSTRDARKQAMQLGESMATQVDHARHAVMDGVESATTAIGLTSPSPKRRHSNGHNGHALSTRTKRPSRVQAA